MSPAGRGEGGVPAARGRGSRAGQAAPGRPVGPAAAAEGVCYFEDLEVGVPLETPGLTLTQPHVILFGGLTGDRPGDPDAVPDLLPLCVSSGLGWRVPRPPLVVLAFMGFEWRFLGRVRVGDTIRSVSRTLTKRALKDAGVVVEERSILNQRGEVVQAGRLTLLVARRPAP